MEEKEIGSGVSRRQFLRRSAGAGLALTAMPALLVACGGDEEAAPPPPAEPAPAEPAPAEPAPAEPPAEGGAPGNIRWITPRGTLDVMDDYNLRVANEMGYFSALNVTVELIAGTGENEMQQLAENQVDMGYPSPGVVTTAINAGVPVILAWEMIPGQVFNFALREDSPITSASELGGTTMAVWTVGWKPIIDPLLVEAGVDPESVTLVEGGPQWNQLVSEGQADVALSWEGLRAQLVGQGLPFKFILGSEFSDGPSNGYAIRNADLGDPALVDLYTRFFTANVQAFEFTRANPQAAAQITYNQLPALAETLEPQLALDSMIELAHGYHQTSRDGFGFGYHPPDVWEKYLGFIFNDLKQTDRLLTAEEVYTNQFVEPANANADVAKAQADAAAFELDENFSATTVPDVEI
jgi:NitT/TauT family transport system substrate-binding protein